MLCSPASSLVSTVMNDIISTMFNQKFMDELFKPQELYSKKALRTVYDRLAHASIMRLNQASMDKVSSCLHPQGCVSYGLPQTGVQGDDVCSGAWQKTGTCDHGLFLSFKLGRTPEVIHTNPSVQFSLSAMFNSL